MWLQFGKLVEPNGVRWMDLQVSHGVRCLQYMATTLVVLWFMYWSGCLIRAIHKEDPSSFLIPLSITVVSYLIASEVYSWH